MLISSFPCCIVIIDAIGCQAEIAEMIIEKEADDVLSPKENQGHLFEDVHLLFEVLKQSLCKAYAFDDNMTVNKDA